MNLNLNHITETEFDKNIMTVGLARGECYVRQKYGYCKKGECLKCEKAKMIVRCREEMAVCDRLRVDSIAEQVLSSYDRKVEKDKQINRGCHLFILGFIILIVAIFVALGMGY